MRGHEHVLTLRRAGRAPTAIWLDDMGFKTGLAKTWPQWSKSAQVEVDPAESVRTLDLRFAVGMTVFANCVSRQRMDSITAAAMECGAQRVIGSLFAFDGRGNCETLAMTDTAGLMVWES